MLNVKKMTWLVESRTKIQQQLLDLYIFGEEHKDRITANNQMRRVHGWLTGSAFSLWRSVFQASTYDGAGNNIEAVNVRAEQKLLADLIADNAATYQTEKNSWSFGYYLNNARFRLISLHGELHARYRTPAVDSKVLEIKKAMETSIAAQDAWDQAFELSNQMMTIMQRFSREDG